LPDPIGIPEESIMPNTKSWSSLALAVALCLPMTAGASAQSDPAEEPTTAPITLPELEGLAWHRSIDVSGPQIASDADEIEVGQWTTLVESAGASLEELEYTYQAAFDPSALPDLGGLATVRVAGADTDALRAAVVDDIVNQVVSLGDEPPEPQEATIGGKDVVVVELPEAAGFADAIVYASADVVYVLLLAEELAAQALQQLP
jgi:hypothetical protein